MVESVCWRWRRGEDVILLTLHYNLGIRCLPTIAMVHCDLVKFWIILTQGLSTLEYRQMILATIDVRPRRWRRVQNPTREYLTLMLLPLVLYRHWLTVCGWEGANMSGLLTSFLLWVLIKCGLWVATRHCNDSFYCVTIIGHNGDYAAVLWALSIRFCNYQPNSGLCIYRQEQRRFLLKIDIVAYAPSEMVTILRNMIAIAVIVHIWEPDQTIIHSNEQ